MQCCTGTEHEVGHDNCYAFGGLESDRFACDAEFFACLAVSGMPEDLAWARYRAVRRFGRGAYNYTTHKTRGPGR
jgi:hypothetical protein